MAGSTASVIAFIMVFVLLLVAANLMPTIVAQWANSTYTGLTGAAATIADLTPLFLVIGVGLLYVIKKFG